ncbi:MAG: energy-coupling factor transporter ATPase [Fretibacterium sp.]|nr:energy-coupling factor transporter ATPase [Fretibacterium sp.]
MQNNAEKAVEVRDFSFTYRGGESPALNELNLEVERGRFIVIMGESGAGKSTLANSLNGLIPHFIRGRYEGSVTVNGLPARTTPVSRMAREIGLVFQDFEAQLFSTNAGLEIAFGPENFGVPREEIAPRIGDVLSTVNLEGFGGRHPATLSGGQKQRLAIGSVLAARPSVLCMDEPTTDLDPMGKIEVFTLAEGLRAQGDLTLIIVEHETEEALHAERLILMKKGRILADGAPGDLLRDTALVAEAGIRPLQVPQFFAGLDVCPPDELPLLPDEGAECFRSRGLALDDARYRELLDRDAEREARYGETVVEIEGLTHVYPNGGSAVNDVSLRIREREFVAVLGHNGSGKTTLVKHFNGLLLPSAGRALIRGKDTTKHSVFEIGREVGYVFQNPDHQIFADNVFDEVAFSPRIRGCSAGEVASRVTEALEAVGLQGYEKRDPFTLGKGERQRVAVASVLSARPGVIILDEPTTGLDYGEQKRMMELIRKLNEAGQTIVMITHTLWVVAEYAHRIVTMKDGRVLLDGPAREVLARTEELAASHLRPPHIVELGNRLGRTVLSVEELAHCTRSGEGRDA